MAKTIIYLGLFMKKIWALTLLAPLLNTQANSGEFDINKHLSLNPKNRVATNSGWFKVDESDVNFVMTYNGFNYKTHKRVRNREIIYKALDMIKNAEKQITLSVFLFDNMYSKTIPDFDVVEELTNTLLAKKKEKPEIKITVILDPLHRSYSRRTSPSVQKFIDNGIDVFYSDLLATKAASKLGFPEGIGHVGRILDEISLGLFGSVVNTTAAAINMPFAGNLDGHTIDLEVAFGASLLKANHRKILVTDINGSDQYETLVSSANPHNGSDDSTNTALSVKGDLAKFVYSVLREDAAHSMLKQTTIPLTIGMKKYAQLSNDSKEKYRLPKYSPKRLKEYFSEVLPPIDLESLDKGSEDKNVSAKFVSEIEVRKEAIRLLKEAQDDDIIRLQMFYLSEPEIVKTISEVSKRSGRKNNPILILLDPSKDAFNKIKDGTPNRQVAHFLVNELGSNIKLRWYATHGEQNHAKILSITNEESSKYEIFTGSTNWTGKNMNNINMEANLSIKGAKKLNDKFNKIFDKLFYNQEENILYSWDYSAYDLKTTMNLNAGQEVVKDWSEEKINSWIDNHKEEVIAIFTKKYQTSLSSLTDIQLRNWALEKIHEDKSETMRAVRYIVGSSVNRDMTSKKLKKWRNDYMKKWIKGENLGFVAW